MITYFSADIKAVEKDCCRLMLRPVLRRPDAVPTQE